MFEIEISENFRRVLQEHASVYANNPLDGYTQSSIGYQKGRSRRLILRLHGVGCLSPNEARGGENRLNVKLRHTGTASAAAEWVHRRAGYTGGRLAMKHALASLPGVFLIKSTDIGRPAVMTTHGANLQIAYDPTAHPAQQRFAIAHEVGHALLHAGHLDLWRVKGHTDAQAEVVADLFAFVLLAPLWAVEREIIRVRGPILSGQSMMGCGNEKMICDVLDVPARVAQQQVHSLACWLDAPHFS